MGLANTPFNYFAFVCHKRKDFDLPTHILEVGTGRVGKSTCALRLAEVIYKMRGKDLGMPFLTSKIVWNAYQSFESFKVIKDDYVLGDEGIWLADKRESMQYTNIKYSQLINTMGSNRNILNTLIQDYDDFDKRIVKKANFLTLNYRRSLAYLFSKSLNFPIVKSSILNVKKFEDREEILEDLDRAGFELKRLPTYMMKLEFKEYAENDPFWIEYNRIKKLNQDAVLEEIKKHYAEMSPDQAQLDSITANIMNPSIKNDNVILLKDIH